jgi:hypothetical protein
VETLVSLKDLQNGKKPVALPVEVEKEDAGQISVLQVSAMKMEKIANLKLEEVPEAQISFVSGLEIADLLRLYEMKAFKNIYGKKLDGKLAARRAFDNGWDAVEENAIERTLELMAKNGDPDFLLRAAFTANKAQRRRVAGNKPIDARQNGHAVVNLSLKFVSNANTMNITPMREKPIPKQQKSIISPGRVEALLTSDDSEAIIEVDPQAFEEALEAVNA